MNKDILRAIARNIRWLGTARYRKLFRASPIFALEFAAFIVTVAFLDCAKMLVGTDKAPKAS